MSARRGEERCVLVNDRSATERRRNTTEDPAVGGGRKKKRNREDNIPMQNRHKKNQLSVELFLLLLRGEKSFVMPGDERKEDLFPKKRGR